MRKVKPSDFKTHCIRTAGIVALTGNAILSGIKFLFAYLSGSLAVTGDALDSATDVLIALVTLIISGIIQQPGDKEHPWGHYRAESTATMVLSFIIFFAGGQLFLTSARRLLTHNFTQNIPFMAVVAAIISIIGKTILALIQYHYGKISDSEIVKANAQNMASDIILSGTILIGLACSQLLKLPLLDPIIALAASLWIIRNAIRIFAQMNNELMDGNTDKTLYKKLFAACSSVPGIKHPHRARIRRMASSFDVDLDIEVAPSLSVYEAHELSEQVERACRMEIPEIYDIVIHIEPENSDLHQPKEEFGLSPETL